MGFENVYHTWEQIKDKPATLKGYGIGDAYAKTEADDLLAAKLPSDNTVNGLRVIRDAGQYSNNSSVTGAIKITIPATLTENTMFRMRVEGYVYTSSKDGWTFNIESHTSEKGTKWHAPKALLKPNSPTDTVRFGFDGTSLCILLGTTSTRWHYPKMYIAEVMVGYVGMSSFPSKLNISLITDETGITFTDGTVKTLATKESLDASVALLAPKNNPVLTGDITVQNVPGDGTTTHRNTKLDTSDLAAYCRSVILLHRVYTDTRISEFNFCAGTFHALRGGTGNSRSEILHVNTDSAAIQNRYNLWADLANQYGKDNLPYLATCLYKTKPYVCLVLPYGDAHFSKGIFFEGRAVAESGYENLKVISFYNTNTSTVLNQEIYDSLTKVEYTGSYLFNGTGYAPDGYGLGTKAVAVTGDWNDHITTGFYMGYNLANAPTFVEGYSHWYFVDSAKHNDKYAYQQAHGFGNAAPKTYERWLVNGTWETWKEIATTDHTHSSLHNIPDTRDVGTKPNDYNRSFRPSFKRNSVIGKPDNSSYSSVLGLRSWDNSSGGNAHELAFTGNGNLCHRSGATTEWGAWKQIATTSNPSNFSPSTTNAYTLGTADFLWAQIFAASATINTSDRNAKTDITNTTLGLDFVNGLRPVEFKYKVRQNVVTTVQDGTEPVEIEPAIYDEEGNVVTEAVIEERPKYKEVITALPGIRTHVGLIAQEVETALEGKDVGIFTKDWETGQYGLRYEEIIPPLIKAIQELLARINQLEAKAR